MTSAIERYPWSATIWEWTARQIYWRAPSLFDRLSGRSRRVRPPATRVDAAAFAAELRLLVSPGDRPCLVHSALGNLEWLDAQGQPLTGLSAAMWLLGVLRDLVGPNGTLCLPTHPRYDANPGFMFDKSALSLKYDVARTPSNVGLLTEMFRRRPGCRRSHHPLSSMAAIGPLAENLVVGNLDDPTDPEPLPHGASSSYYRFCQADGLVVGIGLPLIKALTVIHVAEEVAERAWPVAGFFYRRKFQVANEQGALRDVVVRERRPEFARSLTLGRVRADLLREGIFRECQIAGVAVATADAKSVFEYMRDRQRTSTYPYLWPRIARWGKPRRAPVG